MKTFVVAKNEANTKSQTKPMQGAVVIDVLKKNYHPNAPVRVSITYIFDCLYLVNGTARYTLQEHQTIPTNTTVSKVSDIENEWWSMRKIDFKGFREMRKCMAKIIL